MGFIGFLVGRAKSGGSDVGRDFRGWRVHSNRLKATTRVQVDFGPWSGSGFEVGLRSCAWGDEGPGVAPGKLTDELTDELAGDSPVGLEGAEFPE
jgi:hypothetical protein